MELRNMDERIIKDEETGVITAIDGRRTYVQPNEGLAVWVAVSNGLANTHNEDPAYDGFTFHSVEVTYIHEPHTPEQWREGTCTYDHIISLEDYLTAHPEAQDPPAGRIYPDTDLLIDYGIKANHTPDWVKRWGTN